MRQLILQVIAQTIFYRSIFWIEIFLCFCHTTNLINTNISYPEKLENITFQTKQSENKVVEDSDNSLSTNQNNKTSLAAKNDNLTIENTPRTDEDEVDGNTKNGGSTPQKNVSFDETSADNRRVEEKNGEWRKI